MLETSFVVTTPSGKSLTVSLAISPPQLDSDGQWVVQAECPAIPHATATFIRDDPLTCVCFTLKLLRRFIREEFAKGYRAEHWADVNDFIDDIFDIEPEEPTPIKPITCKHKKSS